MKKLTRTTRALLAGGIAVAGAMSMSPGPVAAQDRVDWAHHGNDCFYINACDYATTQNDNHTLVVNDNECDNNSVRAEYYRSGVSGQRTLHALGCHGGERTATDWAHPVTKMRVCEESKGCGAWKTIGVG